MFDSFCASRVISGLERLEGRGAQFRPEGPFRLDSSPRPERVYTRFSVNGAPQLEEGPLKLRNSPI